MLRVTQSIVINVPTRDRLADETKQLGKNYCNTGWQINITMLIFINMYETLLLRASKSFGNTCFCLKYSKTVINKVGSVSVQQERNVQNSPRGWEQGWLY
jgi:hypothetical protein